MAARQMQVADEDDNMIERRSRRRSIGEWLEDEIDDEPPRRSRRRHDDEDRRFDAIASAISMLEDRLESAVQPQPALNPAFPGPSQNFTASLDQQVQGIGQRLDPRRPGPSPYADSRQPAHINPAGPQFFRTSEPNSPLPPAQIPALVTPGSRDITLVESLRRDVQLLRNAILHSPENRTLQSLEGEIRSLNRKLNENGVGKTARDLQELKARVEYVGRVVQEGGAHENNRYLQGQLQQLNDNISRVQRPMLPDRLVQDIRRELAVATRQLVPLSIQDARTLEKNIQFLAERLDSLRARQPDNARLQALEGQIGKLSGQLSETEKSFSGLERMERSLVEIAARVQMSGDPTELGSFDAKTASVLRGFQKQIEDVKSATDASDRRMHQALQALQEVMIKVADHGGGAKTARARKNVKFGQRGVSSEPKSATAAAREAAARAAQMQDDQEDADAAGLNLAPAEEASQEPATSFTAATPAQGRRIDVRRPLTADVSLRTDDRLEPSNVRPFRRIKHYSTQLALAAAGVIIVIGVYNMLGPLLSGEQTATASVSQAIEEARQASAMMPHTTIAKETPPPAQPQERVASLEPAVLPQKLSPDLPPFPETIISQRLRQGALNGDVRAFYEIGSRYVDGRGGAPHDVEKGLEWLQLAADRKHAPALFRLGQIYEKGQGVTRNPQQALRNYAAAGELGNRKALHNLATMYASGVDGHPNFDKAFPLFQRAAELNLVDSQYNLAILYVNGLGVKQNMVEAYKWFAIAASNDREAASKRDEVASHFDGQTLVKARLAAKSFKPKALDPAANEEIIPASAWEDQTARASDISTLPPSPEEASTPDGNGLSIQLPAQPAGTARKR